MKGSRIFWNSQLDIQFSGFWSRAPPSVHIFGHAALVDGFSSQLAWQKMRTKPYANSPPSLVTQRYITPVGGMWLRVGLLMLTVFISQKWTEWTEQTVLFHHSSQQCREPNQEWGSLLESVHGKRAREVHTHTMVGTPQSQLGESAWMCSLGYNWNVTTVNNPKK